jgi:hypothetical protein
MEDWMSGVLTLYPISSRKRPKKCWCGMPEFPNPFFSEKALLHHSSAPLLREPGERKTAGIPRIPLAFGVWAQSRAPLCYLKNLFFNGNESLSEIS